VRHPNSEDGYCRSPSAAVLSTGTSKFWRHFFALAPHFLHKEEKKHKLRDTSPPIAMQTFQPNCTLPDSGPNFANGVNVRDTLTIV